MEKIFCDWCGEPAIEDQKLCHKCLIAQKQAALGKKLVNPDSKNNLSSHNQIAKFSGTILGMALWGAAFVTLMLIMVAAGLVGTCSTIVMFSIGSVGDFGFLLLLALGAFLIAFLMFISIGKLHKKTPDKYKKLLAFKFKKPL